MQGFCLALEAAVRKFVSFMKAIPGFQLLSAQDQASMIRSKWERDDFYSLLY